GIRFIFPHAPYRPITINNGYVMRGWYDIASLQINQQEDEQGINESSALLKALINSEIQRGISSNRIILAGFSQGGAIALNTGLKFELPLAGIMALSTYLPLADQLPNSISDANRNTPIIMGHGLQDEIINFNTAVASRGQLQSLDLPIQWHDYLMGHSVCAEEIAHVREWLISCLA
ncbi:MAG: alpha/beta hydrolase, partial [Gammaproteobacteria bacterium]|nr:alpha/beta hydrolase [Gammaproteobacteria bacterium]